MNKAVQRSALRSLAMVVGLCLTLLHGVQAQDQTADANTPEAAAAQLLEATRKQDWDGYIRLMHPQALDDFKKMMAPFAEAAATKEIAQMFFKVKSKAEYAALSSGEAFKRFMQNVVGAEPIMKEAISSIQAEPLGHVMEGADTAHVVTRTKAGAQGITTTKMAVITMKRDAETWKAMLSGEIDGFARALAMSANRPSTTPQTTKPPIKKQPQKTTKKKR